MGLSLRKFNIFTATIAVIIFTMGANAPSVAQPSTRPNLPTREAQQKLVEGLVPVTPERRLRRELSAPKLAEEGWFSPQASDESNTAEARVGLAELEAITRNVRAAAGQRRLPPAESGLYSPAMSARNTSSSTTPPRSPSSRAEQCLAESTTQAAKRRGEEPTRENCGS